MRRCAYAHTFVEKLGTVLLGDDGRWQMNGNHGEEDVTGREPLFHDQFQQWLATFVELVAIVTLQLDVQFFQQGCVVVLLAIHDRSENLEDGIEDELAETTGVT